MNVVEDKKIAVDRLVDQAIVGVCRIAQRSTDFPHITAKGEWQYTADGVWTGGFWAGLLWLAGEQLKDAVLLQRARQFTDRLLPRRSDTHNHDLGFMFFPSAVRAWRITHDERYRLAGIEAAEALAGQFDERGGFIPGWGFFGAEHWRGAVLVDTLMNLPLLVWATQQGGNTRLLEVARRHLATTLRFHMRPNGSVFHLYRFDDATGRPIAGDTYQGLSPESSWARGQAWALTGLAILAEMLDDRACREAGERVAAFYLSRLPSDGVPPWDLDAQGPDEPRDSSAAAIASYGLQRLARVTGDLRYRRAAVDQLDALASTCANHSERGGLLLHATADLPHALGIDESTMYGDYYYLKSLLFLRAESR